MVRKVRKEKLKAMCFRGAEKETRSRGRKRGRDGQRRRMDGERDKSGR